MKYDPKYEQLISKAESFSVGKAERQPLYDDPKSPGPGAYLSTKYTNTGFEISLGMSRKLE